jgi:hypothetical protein
MKERPRLSMLSSVTSSSLFHSAMPALLITYCADGRPAEALRPATYATLMRLVASLSQGPERRRLTGMPCMGCTPCQGTRASASAWAHVKPWDALSKTAGPCLPSRGQRLLGN